MTPGKSALSAVHAALWSALHLDPTLTTLAPGGVWDCVPQDPTFPYLRIAELVETPEDTAGEKRRQVGFTVHVFSTYAGLREAYDIADRVIALVRYTPLTLAGWAHGGTTHDRTIADEPIFDDALQVQHVLVEGTVHVEEA
jgi:hypothetical protein